MPVPVGSPSPSTNDDVLEPAWSRKLKSLQKAFGFAVHSATAPQPAGDFPQCENGPVFVDAAKMKEDLKKQMMKPVYDVGMFYHEAGCAQRVARHSLFEAVTLAIICMNALWISVDTDLNTAATLAEADVVFQIAENFFCGYFFFEWLVRFTAFKRKCNGCRDAWFVFDSCLLMLMVLETWVMTLLVLLSGADSGSGMGNASILRMARLLRLTRMARMVRLLRVMPELMILIKGMFAAMRSVMFTLFLLVCMVYIFAILFRQLGEGTAVGDRYFSSVPQAMATLLHRCTFIDEFVPLADYTAEHSPGLLVVLYCYILMASLTLMNMLIGVLVDVVQAVASTEREAMKMAYVKERILFILKNTGLDANNDGVISRDEFMTLLTNPLASRTFLDVGVDPVNLVDATDFIFQGEELDENGDLLDKELSFADLMEVTLALRGSNTATVRDIVDLRKFVQKEVKSVKEIMGTRRESLAGGGSPARQPRELVGSGNSGIPGGQMGRPMAPLGFFPERLVDDEPCSLTPELQSFLGMHKLGVPHNSVESSKEFALLPVADATCSLFHKRAETSLRKLLDELAEQHEGSLTELRSENKRLVDELTKRRLRQQWSVDGHMSQSSAAPQEGRIPHEGPPSKPPVPKLPMDTSEHLAQWPENGLSPCTLPEALPSKPRPLQPVDGV